MTNNRIRTAVIGIGNCSAALVEGISYYRSNPESNHGLLFPQLAGYAVSDIDFVVGFDINSEKVGKPISEAIYCKPNNFVRLDGVAVRNDGIVQRGPTFDGNPPHLSAYVTESKESPVNVTEILKEAKVDVVVNLLPTGSIEASEFYANCAADAGCAFINCIPSIIAQNDKFISLYQKKGLPLIGDDIKSQIGTTILHRSLLNMLKIRGAVLKSTSQINVGGNMDFVNFVERSETKLISKMKSLKAVAKDGIIHVDNIYDPTRGPYKTAYIEISATIFGGSEINLTVKLQSDDKPNSAGVLCDLIRIAKGGLDRRITGVMHSASAYYMKSAPRQMNDQNAFLEIEKEWAS